MKLLNGRTSVPAIPSNRSIPVEEAAEVLPYVVRRDNKLSAAFAKKEHAEDYARDRSYSDESTFVVHTATAVLYVYRDGDDVRS
jgi:hypothetical protein